MSNTLQHHGVKGMKWGVRKERKATSVANLLSKAGRAKRNDEITKQRARLHSGEINKEYKAAKQQYKQDRKTLGRHHALGILKTARMKKMRDINTSTMAKTGKEATVLALIAAGFMSYQVIDVMRNG